MIRWSNSGIYEVTTLKCLGKQYPPFIFRIKIRIVFFLYKNIENEIDCKDIMENIKVDKNYLSKILSALVIEGLIKKTPVVRRSTNSESFFTIALTRKGIRYARKIISVVTEETGIPEK